MTAIISMGLQSGSTALPLKEQNGHLLLSAFDYDKQKLIDLIANTCTRTVMIPSRLTGKVSWVSRYKNCDQLWEDMPLLGIKIRKKKDVWVIEDAQKNTDMTIYAVKHYPIDKFLKLINEKLSSSKQCLSVTHSSELVCPNDPRTQFLLQAIDRPVKQVDVQAWVWLADKNDMKKHHLWKGEQSKPLPTQLMPLGRWLRWIDKISVLAQKGRVQLLASPQMVVTNQTKATIAAGDEVPYWHEKNSEMVVDFKKALLSLSVKPLVISEQKGLYEFELSYDKPSASHGQYRHIIRHHLKTQVEMPFEQAVLIGGIEQTFHEKEDSCPMYLEKIPYLGNLLCDSDQKTHHKSLYMLITVNRTRILESGVDV